MMDVDRPTSLEELIKDLAKVYMTLIESVNELEWVVAHLTGMDTPDHTAVTLSPLAGLLGDLSGLINSYSKAIYRFDQATTQVKAALVKSEKVELDHSQYANTGRDRESAVRSMTQDPIREKKW